MSERTRNVLAGTVSLVALLIMVVGLWPQAEATTDLSERSDAIAARLKCPFCAGESLAEAQSGVARDLRTLIDELVVSGATDAEVFDEFVDRYGEQILLDPPRTGWGVGLWLIPLLIGGLGVWAILGLRRRTATSGESVEAEREDATP